MKSEFDGERIVLTKEQNSHHKTLTKRFEVNYQGNITVIVESEFEDDDISTRRNSVLITRHELPGILEAYHFATQDHGGCPHCGR